MCYSKARTRPNARDSGGFLSPWPFSGWMCRAGPNKRELHLPIVLEKKGWTWTLGQGPCCFSPPAHGLAKGGKLEEEEETEDGAHGNYSGAYDLTSLL